MTVTDRPPRMCGEPGCPELTQDGPYCAAHKRDNANERARAWKRKLYKTAGWQRTRRFVLNRQYVCADPHKTGCHEAAMVVDHIKDPTTKAEFFDLSNLQGLCKFCHDMKTGKETVGA